MPKHSTAVFLIALLCATCAATAQRLEFVSRVDVPNTILDLTTNGDTVAVLSNFGTSGTIQLYDATSGASTRTLTSADLPQGLILGRHIESDATTLYTNATLETKEGTEHHLVMFDLKTQSVSGTLLLADASTNKTLLNLSSGDGYTVVCFDDPGLMTNPPYSVSLYKHVTSEMLWTVVPHETRPTFGKSGLAVGGGYVAVGSELGFSQDEIGVVYMYPIESGELGYTLEATIRRPALFGSVIEIEGPSMIVAAPVPQSTPVATNQVRVTHFATQSGDLVQSLRFSISLIEERDRFGSSIGVSGSVAAIGAPLSDLTETDAGAVFLVDITDGRRLATLTPEETTNNDRFGSLVTFRDEVLAISAQSDPPSVFLYRYDDTRPCSKIDYDFSQSIDFADASAYLSLFVQGSLMADLNNSTRLDLSDVALFLALFAAGCP